MKKTYQSPQCLAILLADDDVLTESQFTPVSTAEEGDIGGEGGASVDF